MAKKIFLQLFKGSPPHGQSNLLWTFFIISSYMVLFFLHLQNNLDLPPYQFEEISKLRFLHYFDTYRQFLPGNHGSTAFYGHPGLHHLTLFTFMKYGGANLFSIRLFNIIFGIATLISLYALFLNITKNKLTSFLASISFGIYPDVALYTPLFFQDLAGLCLSSLALLFFFKRRLILYFIFGSCATLILESSIAFIIAPAIYFMLFKSHRNLSKIIQALLAAIPLLIFFVFEKIRTGNWSNSIGVVLNNDTRSYLDGSLFKSIYAYLDMYFPAWFTITVEAMIILLLILQFYRHRLAFPFKSTCLIIISVQLIVFFFILNEHTVLRDFFAIVAFLFLLIFHLINRASPAPIYRISFFCLYLFAIYSRIYRGTLPTYDERFQSIIQVKQAAQQLKKDPLIFLAEISQSPYTMNFLNYVQEEYDETYNLEEVTVYVCLPIWSHAVQEFSHRKQGFLNKRLSEDCLKQKTPKIYYKNNN